MLRPDRLRVVVAGMVAGVPDQGGAAWAVLNWVYGLRSLGHEVLLIDQVDCITPERCAALHTVATQSGLTGHAALVTPTRSSTGLDYREVAEFCERADVLINLAGTLRNPDLCGAPSRRAYVDLDPGFTQVWQHQGLDIGLEGHTHHFTVGLGVAGPEWRLPTCGLEWTPILPPVALDHWQPSTSAGRDAWTTVGHWRGYGSAEHDGTVLGQRAHSWRELMDLPMLTTEKLLPALAIHPGEDHDIAALDAHGWAWLSPADVSATPADYQDFVQGSKGELGIAKRGYVTTKSGWFSDRSACYLAAGRPVVAQDTGWSAHLPTGMGLFAFTTADEAAEAMAMASRDLARHESAARDVATETFDARSIITHLLEELSS